MCLLDTQGKLYVSLWLTQYLSVQMYVTQDMINDPNRVGGLWGQTSDANNTPIVEFGAGNFRVWDAAKAAEEACTMRE